MQITRCQPSPSQENLQDQKLWETAQRQNAEAAAVKRLDLLIDAQRRQVAHYAGEHWQPLLDYLSGQLKALPEG